MPTLYDGQYNVVVRQAGVDTQIYQAVTNASGGYDLTLKVTLLGVDARQLVGANFSNSNTRVVFADPVANPGTNSADILVGTLGNDTLDGLYGPDTLTGGPGDDILTGDSGIPQTQYPGFPAYFGTLTSSLVNGLGGQVGFGEAAMPRADYGAVNVVSLPLPSTFNGGSVTVNGTAVSQIQIDADGWVTIGGMKLAIWPDEGVDTDRGPLSPSVGGNSAGTNQIWYDFDSATSTLTVTWDDVGRYNNGTVPNAFQMQLKVVGPDQFDVVYRFEATSWEYYYSYDSYAPYIQMGTSTPTYFPMPSGGVVNLDTSAGNTGQPGVFVVKVRGGSVVTGYKFENDILQGGGGNDVLDGGLGDDFLDGGAGNDVLRGGVGNDSLTDTTGGDDQLFGGDGDDVLNDTVGANIVDGGAGNDVIYSSRGGDTLTGGTGSDLFYDYWSWRNGPVTTITDFQAGAGGDNLSVSYTMYDGNCSSVLIGQVGADTIVYGVRNLSTGPQVEQRFRLVNVDASTLVAANFSNYAISRIEDQTLTGTAAADTIYGGFGNDTIDGGAGADTLYGSAGNDHLIGDQGLTATVDLGAYFGSISKTLIDGLGGAIGFGEGVQARTDYIDSTIPIPAGFNSGSVTVNGASVTSLYFNTNGEVALGSLRVGIWPQDVNTSAPASTSTPGGTSKGSNQVWYDFDSATNTITVTWDDVHNDDFNSSPNAFQAQIRISDPTRSTSFTATNSSVGTGAARRTSRPQPGASTCRNRRRDGSASARAEAISGCRASGRSRSAGRRSSMAWSKATRSTAATATTSSKAASATMS